MSDHAARAEAYRAWRAAQPSDARTPAPAAVERKNAKRNAAVPRDQWPAWAAAVAALAKAEDRGVGDTIGRTVGPVGGDVFKKWFRRMTGASCGCDARQRRFNDLYPYGEESQEIRPAFEQPSTAV